MGRVDGLAYCVIESGSRIAQAVIVAHKWRCLFDLQNAASDVSFCVVVSSQIISCHVQCVSCHAMSCLSMCKVRCSFLMSS